VAAGRRAASRCDCHWIYFDHEFAAPYTRFDAADWTHDELHEADAVAESVCCAIPEGEQILYSQSAAARFLPDDFAAICQDHIFGREATV
jgi:hypothetical protein